jgi:hypothetical protein
MTFSYKKRKTEQIRLPLGDQDQTKRLEWLRLELPKVMKEVQALEKEGVKDPEKVQRCREAKERLAKLRKELHAMMGSTRRL